MDTRTLLAIVPPDYLEKVRPTIDESIHKLAQTDFREDPIGGLKYSRATSIISSAYKRHGQILGAAVLECLKTIPRLRVWREDEFRLSGESLSVLRELQRVEPCLRKKLNYGQCERTTPLDIIAYDTDGCTLRSYNVKRGNGSYDAGKRRLILDDLMRVNMLLEDYGRQLGLEVRLAEAKIIFYYGLRSIPEPISLTGDELDGHFRFPVFSHIEVANDYFRARLYELIESWEFGITS